MSIKSTVYFYCEKKLSVYQNVFHNDYNLNVNQVHHIKVF